MTTDRVGTSLAAWRGWVPLLALLAVLPCHAQFKIVGPDGKVTYTDRPPSQQDGKVSSLGIRQGTASATGDDVAGLPLELRQAASRYPVTLYVIVGSCDPCDAARQLLRQRGIPFTEKQVQSAEDGDALMKLTGGHDAPTLAIGTQMLRGLAPEVWASYLDAAAYPRESKLPSTYQYPAPTPLTERREASAVRPAAPRASQPGASAPSAASAPNPANPVGIKF